MDAGRDCAVWATSVGRGGVWIAGDLDREDAKMTKARSTKGSRRGGPLRALRASCSSCRFVTSRSKHLVGGDDGVKWALQDEAYVRRLQEHYRLFKEAVAARQERKRNRPQWRRPSPKRRR
jgi:hypothetical protein